MSASVFDQLTSDNQRQGLYRTVAEAYMEIFPTPTIEAKLDVLEPKSYVAVTCSPTKGVDVTLDMVERLAHRGFKVVPHIAAKMVKDDAHLQDILRRLDDLPIISIFVPGGDAERPLGKFETAYDLLRAIADHDHKFAEIGIGVHPEGHPSVSDDVLMEHLLKKQDVSNYMVTQMCFDVDALSGWLRRVRGMGVTLPAWIGLPVGDSVRYLRKRGKIAAGLLKAPTYRPDQLLIDLAPYIADPAYGISGHHIYCFNQVARTEEWRHEFLDALGVLK
jgi:methylenetetrahydrofolate reductase (NADPH)